MPDYDEANVNVERAIGLDAYSKDNQFIGRVMSLLPIVEENVQAFEELPTDAVGPDGTPRGPRHLLINGTGTIVQSNLVVTLDALEIDVPGRRVIVPLTVAELEAMPRHSPYTPEQLEPGL